MGSVRGSGTVVGKSTGGRASALATRLYATRGPCRVQAPESLPRALLASGYTDIVPEVNEEAVIAVLRALEREGVRYKVVGAVALALVGLPRATQDLDIFRLVDRPEDAVNLVLEGQTRRWWSPKDAALARLAAAEDQAGSDKETPMAAGGWSRKTGEGTRYGVRPRHANAPQRPPRKQT